MLNGRQRGGLQSDPWNSLHYLLVGGHNNTLALRETVALSEDKSVEAVEQALGSPVGAELSEKAAKVRRNLLVVSFIAIFLALGHVRLDPNSTILGFKFLGLNDELIRTGLTIVTAYLLIHFLWYVYEALLEWRLRVTGTRVAFVTTARVASEHGDYPNDPRQSTLYSWWNEQARRIQNIGERARSIDESMKVSEERLRALYDEKGKESNLHAVINTISETRTAITELKRSVEHAQETLAAPRIPVSLRRFDRWFMLFLRSENIRWLVIDALVPILVGVSALALLLC